MRDIELLAQVKRGRQRRLVLQAIDPEKPLLVSEIQKRANERIREDGGKEIRLSDVSRTLKTLEELGLAKCLNPPKQRGEKGVLYALTEAGLKTLNWL